MIAIPHLTITVAGMLSQRVMRSSWELINIIIDVVLFVGVSITLGAVINEDVPNYSYLFVGILLFFHSLMIIYRMFIYARYHTYYDPDKVMKFPRFPSVLPEKYRSSSRKKAAELKRKKKAEKGKRKGRGRVRGKGKERVVEVEGEEMMTAEGKAALAEKKRALIAKKRKLIEMKKKRAELLRIKQEAEEEARLARLEAEELESGRGSSKAQVARVETAEDGTQRTVLTKKKDRKRSGLKKKAPVATPPPAAEVEPGSFVFGDDSDSDEDSESVPEPKPKEMTRRERRRAAKERLKKTRS